MRIGFDGTPLLGKRTGIGWATHSLVSELSALKPNNELVIWPITKQDWDDSELDLPHNALSVRHNLSNLAMSLRWAITRRPKIEKLVRCDVFHGTNFLVPPAARIPTVVTVHDLSFLRLSDSISKRVAILKYLLPQSLARANRIVCSTNAVAEELAHWKPKYADKIEVIHLAARTISTPTVDTKAGIPDSPYFLIIGNLSQRKNISTALLSFAALLRSHPEVKLVLVGNQDTSFDLVTEMAKANLTREHVMWTNHLDSTTADYLLKESIALVFPSLYEGFGMPLLEAMEAEVPLIASDIPSSREVAADAAAYFDPSEPEQLTHQMRSLLEDSQFRNRLIEAGKLRRSQFSWQKCAELHLDLYRKLLV